jgi:WD40 repeat protein
MSDIVCLVKTTESAATFTWCQGPDAFDPYQLTEDYFGEFCDCAAWARKCLAEVVACELDRVNRPGDEAAARQLWDACYELAGAGHELHRLLFSPNKSNKGWCNTARDVRDWLRKLRERQAVSSLEVIAEGSRLVPWNVVYDREPDQAAFLAARDGLDHWQPFWGIRYNLAGGKKVDPRRRMPWWQEPAVLLVADAHIRKGLPKDDQERLERFADAHAGFARARGVPPLVESMAQLKKALCGGRPDLVYWLSHATPEKLQLGDEDVTPRQLRRLLEGDDDRDEGPSGLVFLNACRTAEAGAAGSFLDALHNVGLGGLIATEQQTIDTFASPLGVDFLEAFLDRGEPAGRVLQQLRGRVPLGLLYATYCPPHIRVVRAGGAPAPETATDSVEVSLRAAAPGVALGAVAVPADGLPPLPEKPYRSLMYYDRGDRALFAGRDGDVRRFARLLDEPGTRLLVLHGESGVGKSSFLRAGVVPYLEEECLGYRFLRNRSGDTSEPVLFVRATNDLASQLAQALCDFCARPYEGRSPTDKAVRVDLPQLLTLLLGRPPGVKELRERLQTEPAFLGRALAALGDVLPFGPLLVIDQAEEVFTLARKPEDQEGRRRVLELLRQTAGTDGDFKVIVALRTEYYGRLADGLRRGTWDAAGVREYLLTDFSEEALVEAIRRPTLAVRVRHASQVPFEKYGFRYADGVAEEIARRVIAYTTNCQDSVLPLVQVICTQLYEVAAARKQQGQAAVISLDDLGQVGGIEGGMRRHVDGLLARLLPQKGDQKAFKKLLTDEGTRLYLRQADGTLTTALLPAGLLARHWRGAVPFEEMLATASRGEWRLLRVNTLRLGGEEEGRYVSLGHDALAQVAAAWEEQLSRGKRLRRMAALLSAVSAVAAVMAVLLLWTWVYYRRAKASEQAAITAEENERGARRNMQEMLIRESVDHGLRVAEEGDQFAGLLWLGRALTLSDSDAQRAEQAFRMEAVLQQVPALAHQVFHGSTIRSAAVQPEGEPPLLATGGADGKVRLWNLLTGEPVGDPLAGHQGEVNHVAFSDDGRRLVSVGEDGVALVWDVATGHPVGHPLRHDKSIAFAAFSPGAREQASRYVITASADKTARVWDATTGDPVGEPLRHEGRVLHAAFRPGGESVVTAGADNRAILWRLSPDTGAAQLNELKHAGPVAYVAFSRDGRLLATASADATVGLWNAENGAPLQSLKNHTAAVTCVQFSPDGSRLLTASEDWTARVWRVSSSVTVGAGARRSETAPVDLIWQPLRLRHGYRVNHAEFSPDGRYVVTASRDQTACVWDADTGRQLTPRLRHLGPVTHASFSRGGRELLTVGAGAADPARVWDLYRGLSATPVPLGIRGALRCAAADSDGRWALTAAGFRDAPPEIELWEQKTGKLLTTRPFQLGERVTHAAFSADGRWVLVACGDEQNSQSRVYVWQVEALKSGKGPPAHTLRSDGLVTYAAFSPDGRQIVTTRQDWNGKDRTGLAQLWNTQTGEPVKNLPTRGPVSYAAFSRDGTRLVICDGTWREDTPPKSSGQAVIWDATRGDELVQLEGHTKAVNHAAFSPDGRRVATASEDETARIWDADGGKSLLTLKGHTAVVTHVAFSPDGTRLVTASLDQTACLWDTAAGVRLEPLLRHSKAVNQATFSPDGRLVATTGAYGMARVWDVHSRAAVTPPIEHDAPVQAAVFSPDGRQLFVLSHHDPIPERNPATGQSMLPSSTVDFAFRDLVRLAPARTITALHWRLAEGNRDKEHLPALARLLANRQLAGGDLVPVPGEELLRSWNDLRGAYPDVLSGDQTNKTFLDWHWRETNLAEAARQPFAVAWHLGKILERDAKLPPEERLALKDRAKLFVRRGRVYGSSQEQRSAIEDFTRALDLQPEDKDLRRSLLE